MSNVPNSPLETVRLTLQTPWKARNEIERLLWSPLAWVSIMGSDVEVGKGWRFYGLPIWQKHRGSILRLGNRANLRSSVRSNPLGPNHACILSTRRAEASLIIGDDFGMTGGSIICEEQIIIGDRVTIGANTIITDTDFHPIDPNIRMEHPTHGATSPITIEDDVFIGMNVLVLKGVTIGAGSIIGAGSVVTKDIPSGVVAAGNPCRFIRKL